MCDAGRNDKAINSNNNKSIYGTRIMPSDKPSSSSVARRRLGPIARLFSSSSSSSSSTSTFHSDGQVVNEEARTRWTTRTTTTRTHSAAVLQPQPATRQWQLQDQQQRRLFRTSEKETVTRAAEDEKIDRKRITTTTNHLLNENYHQCWTESGGELLVDEASATATGAGGLIRQRKTAVYTRDFPVSDFADSCTCTTQFPSVENLIKMYATMLAERKSEFNNETEGETIAKTRAKSEDEGCPAAPPMFCSSEEDLTLINSGERRVARSTSADSAVDLLEEGMLATARPRRMTLTVTDMPLRPALLPLPEPLALANCCDQSFDDMEACHTCIAVPSKTILEAQLIELPIVPMLDRDGASLSRRESSQSGLSDSTYNEHIRIVRTPSVVVSDYSDDVCGITLEEIEYFRRHRLGRRYSSDGGAESDVSAASSCSNLNYCGSHISILDGVELNFNSNTSGLKTPERKMSNSSTCSTLSGGEEDDTEEASFGQKLADALGKDGEDQDRSIGPVVTTKERKKKPSGWRKLRNIVQWTPFFQTYKKQRYPWVQLAGHQGNFKAGPDQGTVLKKLCPKEELCFRVLMHDIMRPYVPEYKGQFTSDDGEFYLQLQDLLSDFHQPCVMDCKVGVRTYLEEELSKAKEKPKLRKDMYEKMIQIDAMAPTEEEHRAKGVTKPRYMVWRETISSTATLGFRIEGIKKGDGTSSKDFKTTKSREQIYNSFKDFTDQFQHAIPKYIQRLKAIRATLECSEFFQTHEVIGSSLLFVHDALHASIWLIDFAKTVELPEKVAIDHNSAWTVGNHEDGYLIGINNMIDIFTDILEQSSVKSSQQFSSTTTTSKTTSKTTSELSVEGMSLESTEVESRSTLHRSSVGTPSIVKTNSTQQIIILESGRPEVNQEDT